MSRMGLVYTWFALATCLASAGPARSLTIDDFEISQSLSAGPGASVAQGAVVTGPNSIGGTRDLVITRDPSRSGTVDAEIDGAEPGVALLSAARGTAGLWNFRYDGSLDSIPIDPSGLGGIDLTDGGSSDRLRIQVQTETAIGMTILVMTDATSASIAFGLLPVSASFAAIDIPFSAFAAESDAPADFTSVGAIILGFAFFETYDASLVARFASFSTVPEPASITLVAVGLAALTRRTRGSSR